MLAYIWALQTLNEHRNILLCGYFNFPSNIGYSTDLGLEQVVSEPADNNNVLNLVFVSKDVTICTRPHTLMASVSDHKFVSFDAFKHIAEEENEAPLSPSLHDFTYARADWETLSSAISNTNWDEILMEPVPTEQLSETLIKTLIEISSNCCMSTFENLTWREVLQNLIYPNQLLRENYSSPTYAIPKVTKCSTRTS